MDFIECDTWTSFKWSARESISGADDDIASARDANLVRELRYGFRQRDVSDERRSDRVDECDGSGIISRWWLFRCFISDTSRWKQF